MTKIYLRMIAAGVMTLDEVPPLWREEVRVMAEDA